MGKWPRAILLLVLLTLLPQVAAAQRVLLARPPASDAELFEAFGRLQAELRLQDFEVVVLADQGVPRSADELERASQEQGAFAAIALQRSSSGTTAEILIVDRVTGKSTTRKLRIDSSRNGPTLLAVRAADLLRASLVEFAPGERPPQEVAGVESTPPPPEVVRFAQETRRFSLRAGGVALFTPELGFAAGPFLGASVQVGERLGLGLELGGPLHGAQFNTGNGVASVRQEFAQLRASWNLASSIGGPWELGPVLAVGGYHLHGTSVVSSPLVAQTANAWSFLTSVGFGAQRFIDRGVSIGVDAAALLLLPRLVIAVDDQRSSPVALHARVNLHLGVAF